MSKLKIGDRAKLLKLGKCSINDAGNFVSGSGKSEFSSEVTVVSYDDCFSSHPATGIAMVMDGVTEEEVKRNGLIPITSEIIGKDEVLGFLVKPSELERIEDNE